jgi:uncharacterized cupredoxin-like copper-binding protein
LRRSARWFGVTIVALCTVLGLAACGDKADDEPPASGGGSDTGTVDVTVQEWATVPAVATTASGDITFSVTNEGEETHEFVVFRTDLDPTALPTADDGSVDEAGEGIEAVDEIEDIEAGTTRELAVTLEAGNYVFICNVVEKDAGELESHYQKGMRTAFEVI